LCRREVSQGAKLCYARLAQFAGKDGECFPKQETLAAELGVSERQGRAYLTELGEFALVETEQHGLCTSNNYHFLDHVWMHEGEPAAPAASAPDRQSSSAPDRKNTSGQDRRNPAGPKGKEIHLKENQVQEVHSQRARGLPQSENEALEAAKLAGIPEDFARQEFCARDAVGWVNGAGIPIRSWTSYLRKRWTEDQSQRAERLDPELIHAALEWDKARKQARQGGSV